MRKILYLVLKEMKIRLKYRFVWVNMALTPFFIIGPYVFSSRIADVNSLTESVMIGALLWYWLNQYFFGVGDGFTEEREEGALISVVLAPVSLLTFLFSKSIDTFIMNLYITFFTLLFFNLSGVKLEFHLLFLLLLMVSGVYITFFSIFFAALSLWKKRIRSINSTVQFFFGILSGMVNPVENFPIYVRFVSYMIPLTYLISMGRRLIKGDTNGFVFQLLILTTLSVAYLILGIWLLRKAENEIRRKGEWETW
ncbi:ABC transporter permease [Thermotoga sp.]|uniref:ABC transporter permease n=1 Tax=Thermotoga sp. TaxID=28240 RepID=UPI0025E23BEA|nr:ABC transporter permease [Thermotoga sp.]MCD6551793.1 ABC transporter permease [Thermotoga sp.]